MSRLRVLHVVESLDGRLGGLPAAAMAIADAHARAGHEVSIATLESPADGQVTGGGDVTIHAFPPGRLARFSSSPALVAHVRTQALDVVHVHSVWNLATQRAARAAIGRGIPVVLSPHGSLDDFDVAKHRLAKQVLGRLAVRGVLDRVARVLCTSPREERLLVTYGADPATLAVPLPPGPAIAPGPRGRARGSLGVTADAPLVAFVGRLDYKKGIDVLVAAFEHLPADAHLVLAGAGTADYERHVHDLVAGSSAAARIHLPGWLDPQQRADLLHDADVFALLSDRENYGISAVEAAQAGVPAVLSSEVFVGDVLIEAGAALVAERIPEAAAATLRTALEPESQARMRAAARRVVETTLAPAAIDDRLDALLRAVTSAR